MNNRLEVPEELLSLIEKREQGDRRRSAVDCNQTETSDDAPPAEERRRTNRRAADARED